MTNVIYNIDIPDGPNNPSQDQPKMKTNTNSLKSLIEIDHIGFGNNQGGYHNIIHQPPQVSDPGVIAGVGQTYTKTISGDQQLFYESGLGVIGQISNPSGLVIRAAANFIVVATVITPQNYFNIDTALGVGVIRNAMGVYTINFINALPNAFYFPVGNSSVGPVGFSFLTTTSMLVSFNNAITGALADPPFAAIVVFG